MLVGWAKRKNAPVVVAIAGNSFILADVKCEALAP